MCNNDFSLVKAEHFTEKLKTFEKLITNIKQHLICLGCLFDLNLWYEMKEAVFKMVSCNKTSLFYFIDLYLKLCVKI